MTAFSQNSQLSDSEVNSFKHDVASHAKDLKTLSSDFTQTKHIRLMKENSVSNGKLYYKSPDILKWEYHSPYNYKILYKENQLFINDDGDKSVTSLRSHKLFEKLIGLISGSVNGKLMEDPGNFDINYFRSGEQVSAVIIPKDASLKNMFNEIILMFDKENKLKSVQLKEDEGDYTQIDFSNIKLNAELENSIFEN